MVAAFRSTKALAQAGMAVILFGAMAQAEIPAMAAQNTISVPASGVLNISGQGYGHGQGMSQWGAHGAAATGKTATEILRFYYPGTTFTRTSETLLRVRILIDSDGITEVAPSSGLSVTTKSGEKAVLITSSRGIPISRWRVIRDSTGLRLQYLTTSWRTGIVRGRSSFSSVQFNPGPDGRTRLILGQTLRAYRGWIRALPKDGGGSQTQVVTTMTNYLRSVVPSEMPASWPGAALRAQSVAARSYVLRERADKPRGSTWDTCDTTACQVYSGVAAYSLSGKLVRQYEHPLSTLAISQTAGIALFYRGEPALTLFSSSNGGMAKAGSLPYLRGFPDRYDGAIPNSGHSWTGTVSAADISRHYPQLGRITSITLVRDGLGQWGGRIESARITGSRGSVVISGSSLRTVAGLKSTWWTA